MDEQTVPQDQLQQQRRLQRLRSRQKRKLRQRLALALLALILVLSIILLVRGCGAEKAQPEQPLETQTQQPSYELRPEQDMVITLSAVGDIMLFDDQLEDARQNGGLYTFQPNFSAVSGYLGSADLTVGNLELNFCGEPYCGKPDFRAPEALAASLQSMGFDVLQTANTYSIQNGISGLKSTISYLNQLGISHLGTYASPEEKNTNQGVLLKNVNGVKVAMLAFTKGLNSLALPEGSEYAVDLLYRDYSTDYSKLDTAAVLESVEAAKALKPDVIIAMMHWGAEYDSSVSKDQERLTKLLFENGVDAILGTHSHLVGKMETREVTTADGRKKTCFVAYSLGNFYSSMDYKHTQESVLLNLEFTKNGSTGDTSLSGVSYIPLYTVDNGEEAETRFEVLPIRSAIASGLFPELSETLMQALDDLRTATDSDFDAGK